MLNHLSTPKLLKRTTIILAVALFYCRGTSAAELHPETVRAWLQYIRLTESRIAVELDSEPGFLALEFLTPRDATKARETVFSGRVFVGKMKTRNEEGKKIDIPKGMVHHWLGGILIRGVKVDEVVRWFQNYADFKNHFNQVEESRLISRDGDVFHVFLKLREKKIRTVYFNTEHEVIYQQHGPGKVSSRTVATRITQLENPGTTKEREKPEGKDSGYMWRWNSYWRFKQEPKGVIVECESISLSRDIPLPIRWLVLPFTRSIPEEALDSTLKSMREALTRPLNPRANTH